MPQRIPKNGRHLTSEGIVSSAVYALEDAVGSVASGVGRAASGIKNGIGSSVKRIPLVGEKIERATHRTLKGARSLYARALDTIYEGGNRRRRRKWTRKSRK